MKQLLSVFALLAFCSVTAHAELMVTDSMISGGYAYDEFGTWTDPDDATARQAAIDAYNAAFLADSINAGCWNWDGEGVMYVTPYELGATDDWAQPNPWDKSRSVSIQIFNFNDSGYAATYLTGMHYSYDINTSKVASYYRAVYADGNKVMEETIPNAALTGNISHTLAVPLPAPASKVIVYQEFKPMPGQLFTSGNIPQFNRGVPGHEAAIGFFCNFSVTPVSNRFGLAETDGATQVSESGATDTYTLVLTQAPSSNVNISVEPNAPLNVGSGVAVARTLTFTPGNWSTPQTVTVSAGDNAVRTGKYYAGIAHRATSADGNFNNALVRGVTASVLDNDLPALVITPVSAPVELHEQGATSASLTVQLAAAPTAATSVALSSDAAQVSIAPATLNFTTANWSTPQTVTVTAVNDTEVEVYGQAVTVTATASSTDSGYEGVAAGIDVTVFDNDCGAWGLAAGDVNGDCRVDVYDLGILSGQWMSCTTPEEPACVNRLP